MREETLGMFFSLLVKIIVMLSRAFFLKYNFSPTPALLR